MTVKLKNISGLPLVLFPRKGPEAFTVEPGRIVGVPGSLDSESDDALVIGGLSYSKTLWEPVRVKGDK